MLKLTWQLASEPLEAIIGNWVRTETPVEALSTPNLLVI